MGYGYVIVTIVSHPIWYQGTTKGFPCQGVFSISDNAARHPLLTITAPGRPPISEQRTASQRTPTQGGPGAGAAGAAGRCGPRAAEPAARRRPATAPQDKRQRQPTRPRPHTPHTQSKTVRSIDDNLSASFPRAFRGGINSNYASGEQRTRRRQAAQSEQPYQAWFAPVPASHHSPPPAAAHQRRPPRRRGGTREHHQTGSKPAHHRRAPQLRGGHFSASATANLGRAAHPCRSYGDAAQLDIGCQTSTAHPPQGPGRRPVGARGQGCAGGDRTTAAARQGPGRRPVRGEGPGLRRAELTRLGMIDDFRRGHSLCHRFLPAGLPGDVPPIRRANPVDLTFGQTVFFRQLTIGQITLDILAGQFDPFRKAYCDTTIPPFLVSCQDTF